MACIVRAIHGTESYDVTTPYGYGGPVGDGADRFYEAYEDWCRERDIVSTFIRYHPLFENYRAAPHASYASPTVGWRLEGDLLAGMHGKHRNVVRKAQKAGVAVDVTAAPDDLVRVRRRSTSRRWPPGRSSGTTSSRRSTGSG